MHKFAGTACICPSGGRVANVRRTAISNLCTAYRCRQVVASCRGCGEGSLEQTFTTRYSVQPCGYGGVDHLVVLSQRTSAEGQDYQASNYNPCFSWETATCFASGMQSTNNQWRAWQLTLVLLYCQSVQWYDQLWARIWRKRGFCSKRTGQSGSYSTMMTSSISLPVEAIGYIYQFITINE